MFVKVSFFFSFALANFLEFAAFNASGEQFQKRTMVKTPQGPGRNESYD